MKKYKYVRPTKADLERRRINAELRAAHISRNPCVNCGGLIKGQGINSKYCSPCHSNRRILRTYGPLAVRFVQVAVLRGDLPRLDGSIPCEDCGKPAKCYDHRDYFKPMKVSPVCPGCNVRRGSAKNSGFRADKLVKVARA